MLLGTACSLTSSPVYEKRATANALGQPQHPGATSVQHVQLQQAAVLGWGIVHMKYDIVDLNVLLTVKLC